MAQTIPLSRFEKFLARAVVAAYNAKVALMQTTVDGGGALPVKTGEVVLQITGTLVDDMGGVGLNEILRVTKNATPADTTIVETLPEKTITQETAADTESGLEEEAGTGNDSSTQTETGTQKDIGTEILGDEQTQEFGRDVTTDNSFYE